MMQGGAETLGAKVQYRIKLALKVSLFIMGLSSIGVAILADRLGYGQPGSIGISQLLLSVVGLVLLLVAVIGRRIGDLYQVVALLVLTVMLMFGGLELAAIAAYRLELIETFDQSRLTIYEDPPYYQSQEWTSQYWAEAASAENYQYKPYVMWGHEPFQGQMVVVSERGIRRTPGAQCDNGASKVFTFGGSTMWGWGSPDWGTIPAYLQEALAEGSDSAICVINYGEDAFVSSQSFIELMEQLQKGNVPDTVIFYDGVNDVYAGFESGQPGVHMYLDMTSATFEGSTHPLVTWLKSSRQFSLMKDLVRRIYPELLMDREAAIVVNGDGNTRLEGLPEAVANTYLTNYQMVAALAERYSFEFYFFWQPHMAVSQKPLTKAEREMKARMDPRLASLATEVYALMAMAATEHDNLWYLGDIFEEHEQQIWIDEWGHITPEGNELVATGMHYALQHDASENP